MPTKKCFEGGPEKHNKEERVEEGGEASFNGKTTVVEGGKGAGG